MENEPVVNGEPAPSVHLVPFYDDTLVTLEREGTHYVAMRRVVENMGLDWARQSTKLAAQAGKFDRCLMSTVGEDGARREMVCIPVEKLALWLATINPRKVRADLRDKVERYQAESAIALHDYWTKGVAARDDFKEAMDGVLRQVAAMAAELRDLRLLHDQRNAAVTYASVRNLLDEAGALSKGRNGLNRRIGRALKERALFATARGEVAPHLKSAHTGVWLFHRAFAERFMREVGNGLVAAHNDRVTGQTVIDFSAHRARREHPVDAPPL